MNETVDMVVEVATTDTMVVEERRLYFLEAGKDILWF